MCIQRQRTFSAIIIVLCLLVNAFAQQQPAENNATPSASGQPAAASAPTDSGQQPQPQPAPVQPQPPENNAIPSAAGQPAAASAPAIPVQQTQPQTVPAQPQYIVIQQPAPAPAPVPAPATDSSKFSIADILMYVILIVLILMIIKNIMSGLVWLIISKKQESSLIIEDNSNDSYSSRSLTFDSDGVLNNKRFEPCPELSDLDSRFKPGFESYPRPDSDKFELSRKALEEANNQTKDFWNKLDESLKLSAKSEDSIVPQDELQRIADSVQDNMLKRIFRPNSFWMKEIWSDEVPPNSDDLRLFMKDLLKPLQVPEGVAIQFMPSPWRIGFLAVIGSVLGAIIILPFYLILGWCGYHSNILMAMLIGMLLGSGFITGFAFWLASDETRRKTAMIGISVSLASCWLIYCAADYLKKCVLGGSWYTKWIKWFHLDTLGDSWLGKLKERFNLESKEKLQIFNTLKSLKFIPCLAVLILIFLKFPVRFDREEYGKKLKRLYYERIQAIVMLLASIKLNRENVKQQCREEIGRLNEEISRLNAIIDGMPPHEKMLDKAFEIFKEFENVGIQGVADVLVEMQQHFQVCKYSSVTDIDNQRCMLQLQKLLNDPYVQKLLQDNSHPSDDIKEFVWDDEKHALTYRKMGPVYSGDIVLVLKDPNIQNGVVKEQGIVKLKDAFNE